MNKSVYLEGTMWKSGWHYYYAIKYIKNYEYAKKIIYSDNPKSLDIRPDLVRKDWLKIEPSVKRYARGIHEFELREPRDIFKNYERTKDGYIVVEFL